MTEKVYIRDLTESGDFYLATSELWTAYRKAISEGDWEFAESLETGSNEDFFYDP